MTAADDLPPLIRPGIQLFEREWEILQVWANNHALAARAERNAEIKRLDKFIYDLVESKRLAEGEVHEKYRAEITQRDVEIERLRKIVQEYIDDVDVAQERAAKFEGELAELIVERDALRARLEAIEKQPTIVSGRYDLDRGVSVDLIERPEKF